MSCRCAAKRVDADKVATQAVEETGTCKHCGQPIQYMDGIDGGIINNSTTIVKRESTECRACIYRLAYTRKCQPNGGSCDHCRRENS